MTDLLLTIFAALTGTGIAAGLSVWLLGKWVGTRIDASIKAEYDRLKLKHESDQRRRERAQLVAELLAEWMSTPLDDGMSPEQRKRINKLSFEATLWLPEEIAAELSKILQHDPSALNPFDLLLRVRTLLSGQHQLTATNVTQWSRDTELPNRGLPSNFKNGQITVMSVQVKSADEIRSIEFDGTQSLFNVPEGSEVLLTLPKAGNSVLVTTPIIRSLRLLQCKEVDGVRIELTLDVSPKDFANELNRSVYGDANKTG